MGSGLSFRAERVTACRPSGYGCVALRGRSANGNHIIETWQEKAYALNPMNINETSVGTHNRNLQKPWSLKETTR